MARKKTGKVKPHTGGSKNMEAVAIWPSRLLPVDGKPTRSPHERRPGEIETLAPGTVWVARQFLSRDECGAWVTYAEREAEDGFEHIFHEATRYMAHREVHNLERKDAAMAALLFRRMQDRGIIDKISEARWSSDANYRPVGCNPNIKVYKYVKGMWFGKHYDVSDTMDDGNQTEVTVLVYLSECEGGATRFYPVEGRKNSFAFQPEVGAALFHAHGDRCLCHEGEAVLKGTKYVLRTDIVFQHF